MRPAPPTVSTSARDRDRCDWHATARCSTGPRSSPSRSCPTHWPSSCPGASSVARLREWSHRRLDPAERYGLRLTAWTFVFVVLAVPFGLLLWQVVSRGPVTHLDESVARTLRRHVHPGAEVTVLRAVTTLGNPVVLTLAVAAGAVVLIRWRRRRLLAFLLTTVVVGALVNSLVKVVV